MTFVKGQSGNPAGKKKGTPNKRTLLLKERQDEAYKLVDEVLKFVTEQMMGSDEGKKLRAIDKLSGILPFIIPKLSSVDAKIGAEKTVSSIVFKVKKKP